MRRHIRNKQPRVRGVFKKASLNLSVNAIVVFVLAFSMMGVGLFIVKMIREQAGKIIPETFDTTLLDKQPTSEDPIAMPDTLQLKKNKQEEVRIGFYNLENDRVVNARPVLRKCIDQNNPEDELIYDPNAATQATGKLPPLLVGIGQDVGISEAVGYKVTLKEATVTNDADSLSTGTYICEVAIWGKVGLDPSAVDRAVVTDQIYVKIVS